MDARERLTPRPARPGGGPVEATRRDHSQRRSGWERVRSGKPSKVPGVNVYVGPVLTSEEERTLAQRIEAGREAEKRLISEKTTAKERQRLEAAVEDGRRARDEFVEANMRLVVLIARRYVGRSGASLSDMVQEGMFGLLRAVELYDWRQGYRFSTYAQNWIRQFVVRWLDQNSATIKVPGELANLTYQVNQLEAELQSAGEEPTLERVAELLGESPERIEQAKALPQATSMETPTPDGQAVYFEALLADERAPDPEEATIEAATREAVAGALETLDERTRRILELRSGLTDGKVWTLDEIAEELGVTRERIRQIEQLGIATLRHPAFGLTAKEG